MWEVFLTNWNSIRLFLESEQTGHLPRHEIFNSYDISAYRMIILTPFLLLTMSKITFTFAEEGKIRYIIYRNL